MNQRRREGRGWRIRRFFARVFGITATGALLAVGVAVAMMIAGGRQSSVTAPSAAASGDEQAATDERERPRPTLSRRGRAARRAAVAKVRARGYTPVSLATWQPGRTLQALVATPTSDPLGGRRVFFFVGRKPVGTDFREPSARVKVAGRRTARSITLTYRLYGPGNDPCCPQGVRAKVRYRWDGKAVTPQGPTPDRQARVAR